MPIFEQQTDAANDRGWDFTQCDGFAWRNHIGFPPTIDFYHTVNGIEIGEYGGLASRFTNVTIPQGSTINSAHLFIAIQSPGPEQTGADEPGEDFRVYADDVDDSAALTDGEIVAGARTFTTAFRSGPEDRGNYGTEAWLEMAESNPSLGIVNVIQEIINRPGWQSGNALTLIMTGQFQSACGCGGFEGLMRLAAFENTSGEEGTQGEVSPRLVIDYTPPTAPTILAQPIII